MTKRFLTEAKLKKLVKAWKEVHKRQELPEIEADYVYVQLSYMAAGMRQAFHEVPELATPDGHSEEELREPLKALDNPDHLVADAAFVFQQYSRYVLGAFFEKQTKTDVSKAVVQQQLGEAILEMIEQVREQEEPNEDMLQ